MENGDEDEDEDEDEEEQQTYDVASVQGDCAMEMFGQIFTGRTSDFTCTIKRLPKLRGDITFEWKCEAAIGK